VVDGGVFRCADGFGCGSIGGWVAVVVAGAEARVPCQGLTGGGRRQGRDSGGGRGKVEGGAGIGRGRGHGFCL
jgi:hypothetical protein